MAVSRIRLRHTETGGEWECPAEAVGLWRGKGWAPIEETSSAPVVEEAPVVGDTEPAPRGRNPKGSK